MTGPLSAFRRWVERRKARARRKLVVHQFRDEYMDTSAIKGRSATATTVNRFRVTLDQTDIYCGPRGAQARQIFENVVPRPTEVMRFYDADVCRGEKCG